MEELESAVIQIVVLAAMIGVILHAGVFENVGVVVEKFIVQESVEEATNEITPTESFPASVGVDWTK